MKRFLFSVSLTVAMCGPSIALDDTSMCERLTQEGPGLYLTYLIGTNRFPAAKCQGAGYCFAKIGSQNLFDDYGRLFFVGTATPPNEEVVWHVRMQTRARNLDSADLAYLAR